MHHISFSARTVQNHARIKPLLLNILPEDIAKELAENADNTGAEQMVRFAKGLIHF
jgi:hypothetical protein